MAFARAAPPKSALGYHRILSPTAGIKVSPLCLGAMNFGDAWSSFMGTCDKKTAFEIMDYFYDQGGNFIDTANNYQAEESEVWVGEWMEAHGNRDEMVIATKFTSPYRVGKSEKIQSNHVGNAHKSLFLSVDASLKKLKTSYIDLLWLHWWDFTTSIEEIMQTLNVLIQQGKVLYIGVSDTPAWIVSKANQYARDHGLKQFCVYQGLWSASARDVERDIIPMCEAEGMSMCPWGALGRGNFKSAVQRAALEKDAASAEGRKMGGPSDADIKTSIILERLATKHNTLITSIAMAYVRQQMPYRCFPIVGGRKLEHLKGNIEALSVRLSAEEIQEIEEAYGFSFGFPVGFLLDRGDGKSSLRKGAESAFLTQTVAWMDVKPHASVVCQP